MDDIRILKWMGLIIVLGVGYLVTLFLPGHILVIATGILITGLVRWLRTTRQDRGDRGGTLMAFGGLLMVAPLTWLALYFLHRP